MIDAALQSRKDEMHPARAELRDNASLSLPNGLAVLEKVIAWIRHELEAFNTSDAGGAARITAEAIVVTIRRRCCKTNTQEEKTSPKRNDGFFP